MSRSALWSAALATSLVGCPEEGGGADDTSLASSGEALETTGDPDRDSAFARAILPIFAASCSCHDAELGAPFGLVLTGTSTTVAEIHAGLVEQPSMVAALPLVVPGAPEQSFLLRKIEDDLAEVVCDPHCGDPMPPSGVPVSAADTESIRRWIAEGAALR